MSGGGKSPEEAARELKLDIVWPEPNELFVDLDDDASFACFKKQIELLGQFERGTWSEQRSRNGNRHVIVILERTVSNEERLMLQAMLGSDRKRELLGLKQLRAGLARSTCFFRKPVAAHRFGDTVVTPEEVRQAKADARSENRSNGGMYGDEVF
jgi:hypothetical protein